MPSNSRKQEFTWQKVEIRRHSPGEGKETPAFSLPLIELLWASLIWGQRLLLANLKRTGLLLANLQGKNRWRVGLAGPTAAGPVPLHLVRNTGPQRLAHIQTFFERANITPEGYLNYFISSTVQCRDLALLGTLTPPPHRGPTGSTLHPCCR